MPERMPDLARGAYRARLAKTTPEIEAALALRQRAFRGGASGSDRDAYDPLCDHVVIEEIAGGRMVGCFRLLYLADGAEIERSYSAQFYELSSLQAFDAPMVEMGRFCLDPDLAPNPEILRLAWAAMTAYVDANGVEMLFGCSSFHGTEAGEYHDAFALLRDRHLAPAHWVPRVKAPTVFRYASQVQHAPDVKQAMANMPPLLRTYLMMGGWVSDHAVVDLELGTLHVFTGLEIGAIPSSRARVLRAI